MNLLSEYESVVKKNPSLDITTKYTIGGFIEVSPVKIGKYFYKTHPMSGYGGGPTYQIGCSATIQYMPRKKVYRAIWKDHDCGTTTGQIDYKTLKEALKFVIPVFGGIMGYFGNDYIKK